VKQKDVVLRVAGALSSGARPFIVIHIIDMKESTFVFASQCKRYCIDLQTQMLNFIVSRGVVSWLWCARVWLAGCERSTEGEAGEVVEVSSDRSSGAPAEAPERMSPRVEVPYNV
jgi:hypothetical protein